jgi:hypothetical protein
MSFVCPVCGYPGLEEEPRSAEGGGSYEICPCCSFQFGVTDEDLGFSFEDWRQRWKREGMRWDKGDSEPPPGWDPVVQLRRVEDGAE